MSGDLLDDRRCRAKSKRTGERCKRYPVPGGTVCYFHGGASGKALAAAERRRAESEATVLLEQVWKADAPPVTNVVETLYELAGQLKHAMNVMGAQVNTTAPDGPAFLAWSRLVREQRQLLAEVARLNIEDRVVELEQRRADMVTVALRAALEVLSLSPEDRASFIGEFLGQLRVVRGELQ